MPLFRQVNPIIGTRDIDRAVRFYVEGLGFKIKFRNGTPPAEYLGFLRDGVELHMQFQYPDEMGTLRLRIHVDDPDALYAEYSTKDVFSDRTQLRDTPWGTREFAIYDPDRNSLTFYADLKKLV